MQSIPTPQKNAYANETLDTCIEAVLQLRTQMRAASASTMKQIETEVNAWDWHFLSPRIEQLLQEVHAFDIFERCSFQNVCFEYPEDWDRHSSPELSAIKKIGKTARHNYVIRTPDARLKMTELNKQVQQFLGMHLAVKRMMISILSSARP